MEGSVLYVGCAACSGRDQENETSEWAGEIKEILAGVGNDKDKHTSSWGVGGLEGKARR